MRTTYKIVMALAVLLGALVLRPTPSYAWHRWHTYVDVNLGYPYYGPYYDPYYDPYDVPYYYYQPAPAYVVSSSNYQPVVINGTTYYVNNGVYYVYTQYGYQAVATPAGASVQTQAPQAAVSSIGADDTITVNVPNSKGGYTPVVLKKSGTGFTGPQGEYYSEFPKVSQLQTMYGK